MATTPQDFQASFQEFLKQLAEKNESEDPPFVARLRRHFGRDPAGLSVLSESFPERDHPNVQVALDSWLEAEGRSVEIVGVVSDQPFFAVSLSGLATPVRSRRTEAPQEGPVPYTNAVLEAGRVIPCIQSGLLLIKDFEERLAVLVQGPRRESPFSKVTVEVMAGDQARAESFLAELRRTMRTKSVYRGRVVSLKQDRVGNVQVEFHRLAKVSREGIILPEKLLERIERQTIRFSEHSKALREQGRHLKRGILLHGPPGTGKTLTAMYPSRTPRATRWPTSSPDRHRGPTWARGWASPAGLGVVMSAAFFRGLRPRGGGALFPRLPRTPSGTHTCLPRSWRSYALTAGDTRLFIADDRSGRGGSSSRDERVQLLVHRPQRRLSSVGSTPRLMKGSGGRFVPRKR